MIKSLSGSYKTYKSEGIVLRTINYGEADKIVSIYTSKRGKVSCIAKGIRKLTSRKRGSLEIFYKINFFASSGKGLDIITEVECLDDFGQWRDNLKKVASAYELAEMTDKLTVEADENEAIYTILVSAFNELKAAGSKELDLIVERYGESLLRVSGFWPEQKPFPREFNVFQKIEEIIENELKSKKFSRKIRD